MHNLMDWATAKCG